MSIKYILLWLVYASQTGISGKNLRQKLDSVLGGLEKGRRKMLGIKVEAPVSDGTFYSYCGRLVKEGLITADRGLEDDQRETRYVATAKGRERVEQLNQFFKQVFPRKLMEIRRKKGE
ncbi:MAG: hypothetical protein ACTSU5_01730 [Promethearchaeota archaeon]